MRLCTRQSVSSPAPQTLRAITEQTGKRRLENHRFDWNTRQHAYNGYDRLANEKTDSTDCDFLIS